MAGRRFARMRCNFAVRRIQEHLLPHNAPTVPGFDIAGATYPAELTGGDYFDYLTMVNGSTGLVIGDVCGHGVGPALLMASTQVLLRSLAQTNLSLSRILLHANRFLLEATEQDRFITLLLGRLEPLSRSFMYSSAGHPSGYILDSSGGVKRCLVSTSVPLGVLPGAEFPVSESMILESGDFILLVTDGVLEAASPSGVQLGADRALEVARRHCRKKASEILDALLQAVHDFSESPNTADDVTIVVARAE